MNEDAKAQAVKLLEDHQAKLDGIVEDFAKTVDQFKKDAYKKAEAAENAQDDQAAEDLLKDM